MSFRNIPLPLSLIASIVFTTSGYAAQHLSIDHKGNVGNMDEIKKIANLDKNYEFKLVNKVVINNEKTKVKLNQYYLNVPIWGASISATMDKSGYSQVFGHYVGQVGKDIASVTPSISVDKAIDIAHKAAKLSSQAQSLITNEHAQTFILLDKNAKAHLVYFVSFMVDDENQPTRPHFLIDAHSGQIMEQWEGLTTKDAIGPGGNQKTGQYNYGTDYGYLMVTDTCQMDSPNVLTWDMKNLTSGGAVHQFSCIGTPPINTYKFANGAFSPINDAHYFGNVVFNMYKTWFNQSPLTMKLKLRVHYGVNYQNAFWDGLQMTFGDGASTFYPFTGLDVVSHEVSHGFTEQNSNLMYSRQPGGINEAFSDIAGEASEYFNNLAKPVKNDWLVGATILKSSGALRYFSDPTLDGRSIGHAKDYNDTMDVHYTSGVFNKAFYTLANTANWNTEKAFRAFVLANQIYWTQTTSFDQGGCGVLKAARDLGYSMPDVLNAFNVVGVNAGCIVSTNGTMRVAVSGVTQCPIPATQQFTVNYSSSTTSSSLTVTGTTPVSVAIPAGAYAIQVTPEKLPTNSNCNAKYNKNITISENQTTQENINFEYTAPPPPSGCTINTKCVTWGTPNDSWAGSSCQFVIVQPTGMTIPTAFTMQANGLKKLNSMWNAVGVLQNGQVIAKLTDPVYTPSFGFVADGFINLPATASLFTKGQNFTCTLVKK